MHNQNTAEIKKPILNISCFNPQSRTRNAGICIHTFMVNLQKLLINLCLLVSNFGRYNGFTIPFFLSR